MLSLYANDCNLLIVEYLLENSKYNGNTKLNVRENLIYKFKKQFANRLSYDAYIFFLFQNFKSNKPANQ